MSMEDIGGCFSVAPPLILLPNYSKLGKMTLWRLLRSKRNLGTASNILSSTLGQRLMSVEDIGGCFSVAPPLILLPNYSKLGKWHSDGSSEQNITLVQSVRIFGIFLCKSNQIQISPNLFKNEITDTKYYQILWRIQWYKYKFHQIHLRDPK